MSVFKDPEAERNLLASLAAQVDEQVVKPMEAHGWQQGYPSPLPAKADDPPAGEAPKPEDTPKPSDKADDPPKTEPVVESKPQGSPVADASGIDWESTKQPNGKYFGKYDTVEQAIKGVSNVVQMAKEALARNDALTREVVELRQKATAAPQPSTPGSVPVHQEPEVSRKTEPIQSEKLVSVLTKFVEDGSVLDEETLPLLVEGIRDQVRLEAKQVVENTTTAQKEVVAADQQKWAEVEAEMRRSEPDSLNHVDEIELHVKSDPVLAKAVNRAIAEGDYLGATQLAWNSYKKELRVTTKPSQENSKTEAAKKEEQLAAAQIVRKEVVDEARIQAGITPSGTGGVHTSVETTVPQAEIDAAGKEMQQTGHGQRWRALVFGKELTGPLFD